MTSAAAGTFSNSVVIAALRCISCASALLVEITGGDVVVRDQAGRAGRVRVEHRGEIAHLLRRMDEHAAELAAAHHAERGAGRE